MRQALAFTSAFPSLSFDKQQFFCFQTRNIRQMFSAFILERHSPMLCQCHVDWHGGNKARKNYSHKTCCQGLVGRVLHLVASSTTCICCSVYIEPDESECGVSQVSLLGFLCSLSLFLSPSLPCFSSLSLCLFSSQSSLPLLSVSFSLGSLIFLSLLSTTVLFSPSAFVSLVFDEDGTLCVFCHR